MRAGSNLGLAIGGAGVGLVTVFGALVAGLTLAALGPPTERVAGVPATVDATA